MQTMNDTSTTDTTTPEGNAGGNQPAADDKPRVYTQEEFDRASAAARRDGIKVGERAGEKKARSLIDEALKPFAHLLTPKPAGGAGDAPVADPAPTVIPPVAAPPKPPETKGKGTESGAPTDPNVLAELAALKEQIRVRDAEVRALTKETQARSEAEKAAIKVSQKNRAIEEAATHFKAQGLTESAAKALAKAKYLDGDIAIDDRNVVTFRTGDVDDDTGEPEILPIKTGAEKWGRSPEANEHRPPVARGAGHNNTTKGPPMAPPPPDKKIPQSPGSKWQQALNDDTKKRVLARGQA